jgi:PH (Pleckstrin Homology) domain-containing protein
VVKMITGGTEVRARPEAIRPWCFAISVLVLAALGTTAIVLPSTTDGVQFSVWDQIGVAGMGVLLAVGFWQPTRPRLIADEKGVRARGPIGDFRFIPWDVVEAVEFRPKWRWARLILAGDETLSLYAVQRWDRERAVRTMRQLRALHAAAVRPR